MTLPARFLQTYWSEKEKFKKDWTNEFVAIFNKHYNPYCCVKVASHKCNANAVRGGMTINITLTCKNSACCFFTITTGEKINPERAVVLRIERSADIRHKNGEHHRRFISGKNRLAAKQEITNTTVAKMKYSKLGAAPLNAVEAGNLNEAWTNTLLQKLSSESKSMNDLDPDIDKFMYGLIEQYKVKWPGKFYPGFIQRWSKTPYWILLFVEEQLKILHNTKGDVFCHLDSTSRVQDTIDGIDKRCDYYALTLPGNGEVGGFPVAEFITSDQSAPTLTYILSIIVQACQNMFNKSYVIHKMETDFSHALIKSSARALNDMSTIQYVNYIFEKLNVEGCTDKLKLTVLHICSSHLLKAVLRKSKEWSRKKIFKRLAGDSITALIHCTSLEEGKQVFQSIVELFGTEYIDDKKYAEMVQLAEEMGQKKKEGKKKENGNDGDPLSRKLQELFEDTDNMFLADRLREQAEMDKFEKEAPFTFDSEVEMDDEPELDTQDDTKNANSFPLDEELEDSKPKAPQNDTVSTDINDPMYLQSQYYYAFSPILANHMAAEKLKEKKGFKNPCFCVAFLIYLLKRILAYFCLISAEVIKQFGLARSTDASGENWFKRFKYGILDQEKDLYAPRLIVKIESTVSGRILERQHDLTTQRIKDGREAKLQAKMNKIDDGGEEEEEIIVKKRTKRGRKKRKPKRDNLRKKNELKENLHHLDKDYWNRGTCNEPSSKRSNIYFTQSNLIDPKTGKAEPRRPLAMDLSLLEENTSNRPAEDNKQPLQFKPYDAQERFFKENQTYPSEAYFNAKYKVKNTVVKYINGCEITDKYLADLRPKYWISDEIVNSFVSIMPEVASVTGLSVLCVNTFLAPTLAEGRVSPGYVRWMQKNNAMDKQIWLIPINEDNVHWTLVVILPATKTLIYLDSMHGNFDKKLAKNYYYFFKYFEAKLAKKTKSIKLDDWKDWKLHAPKDIPQQTGQSGNCAVHVCVNMYRICSSSDVTYTDSQVTQARKSLAHLLMNYENSSDKVKKAAEDEFDDLLKGDVFEVPAMDEINFEVESTPPCGFSTTREFFGSLIHIAQTQRRGRSCNKK